MLLGLPPGCSEPNQSTIKQHIGRTCQQTAFSALIVLQGSEEHAYLAANAPKCLRAYLQCIDIVRDLQIIQLLLHIGHDICLEAGAAQQIKGHSRQKHIDGMLNCHWVCAACLCIAKRAYRQQAGMSTTQYSRAS